MMDSWIPSKLEPGFAATHSIPRSLRTWTIRSEPGLTAARAPGITAGGRTAPASRAICSAVGGGGGALPPADPSCVACGVPALGAAPPAAAAPTAAVAAPFRNPRRLTLCLDFATDPCLPCDLHAALLSSRHSTHTGRVSGTASDLAPGRFKGPEGP